MRSKIEPMKKVARSLRDKRELILNWFHVEGTVPAGIVEGFNNKLKLITRKSYGFRTQEAYEITLYHSFGALPEGKFPHEFLCRGSFFRAPLPVGSTFSRVWANIHLSHPAWGSVDVANAKRKNWLSPSRPPQICSFTSQSSLV
jgi:hypothetical protein